MDTYKKRIEKAVDLVLAESVNWIKPVDGKPHFVDPIDEEEISAHYGATHMAASLVLWGILHQDDVLKKKGLILLESVLTRWDECTHSPAFHFDFNNFALCLISDALDKSEEDVKGRVREIILETPDSNHPTVNWLPMRMVVNLHRYKWTGNVAYMAKAEECAAQIHSATHLDGGIEDRLPKGVSFNLQYDLATVAVLQYANVHGLKASIEKELGFLLNAVAPDGDINYQGRGTNQIFAWGLWVYLLASSGQEEGLSIALDYLEPRLGIMLSNYNMMLNEWKGAEKYLWWDYHYSSVYTAHLLLWLILAYQDFGKKTIIPQSSSSVETGLNIYRTNNCFVSWFDGKSEYLSERGPAISCIWSSKAGMICKGAFAPWHGAFGNTHSFDNVALLNYCGLTEVHINKDISQNRIIHKLFPAASPKKTWLREAPIFCPIRVAENDGVLNITWNYEGRESVILNVPSIPDALQFEVLANGVSQPLTLIGKIRNQYGWVNVLRTKPVKASQVSLRIPLM